MLKVSQSVLQLSTWSPQRMDWTERVCSCWVDVPLLLLSTCACVEYFGRALESLIKKVTVHLIHGKMKHKRNKIFADFRAVKRSASAPTHQPLLSNLGADVTLTTVQSASQWDLGVHGRDGQRHRYPRRQLGAAVRSPQQCQVSQRDEVCPSVPVWF